jgi:hypothetical protein
MSKFGRTFLDLGLRLKNFAIRVHIRMKGLKL